MFLWTITTNNNETTKHINSRTLWSWRVRYLVKAWGKEGNREMGKQKIYRPMCPLKDILSFMCIFVSFYNSRTYILFILLVSGKWSERSINGVALRKNFFSIFYYGPSCRKEPPSWYAPTAMVLWDPFPAPASQCAPASQLPNSHGNYCPSAQPGIDCEGQSPWGLNGYYRFCDFFTILC